MPMGEEAVIGASLRAGTMAGFFSKSAALGPIALPMTTLVDIHVYKLLAVSFERVT